MYRATACWHNLDIPMSWLMSCVRSSLVADRGKENGVVGIVVLQLQTIIILKAWKFKRTTFMGVEFKGITFACQ